MRYSEQEKEIISILRRHGFSARKIAAIVGRTEKAIFEFYIRHKTTAAKLRWTNIEIKVAQRMRCDGATFSEISEAFFHKRSWRAYQLKLMREKNKRERYDMLTAKNFKS